MRTNECDKFYDMAYVRKSIAEEINKNDDKRLGRIMMDKYENGRYHDEKVADKAIIIYKTWYTAELQRSLTLRNWISYKLSCNTIGRDFFIGIVLTLLSSGIATLFGCSWKRIPIIYGAAFPFREKIQAWFKKST